LACMKSRLHRVSVTSSHISALVCWKGSSTHLRIWGFFCRSPSKKRGWAEK